MPKQSPATHLSSQIRTHARCFPCGKFSGYGIGGAYLGGHNGRTAEQDIAVFQACYEAGFRYFDTAPAKQYGESEIHLGRFLQTVPRDSVFVSSKVNLREGMPVAEVIEAGIRRTLSRMQLDRLDLFQLHDIGAFEKWFDERTIEQVRKVVGRLKSEGLFVAFGLALKERAVLSAGIACGLFDSILTHNDLIAISPSGLSIIREAKSNGMAAINASPLGFGLLTGSDPDLQSRHPQIATRQEMASHFYRYCKKQEVPVVAAALQFPLLFSEPDITLTGPGNMEQLQSTLELLEYSIPLSFWLEWVDCAASLNIGGQGADWQEVKRTLLHCQ